MKITYTEEAVADIVSALTYLIPYIETLGDRRGDLCASPAVAARWADELVGLCRMAFSPGPDIRGYFHGTTVCLSALRAAGRYQEILDLLAINPRTIDRPGNGTLLKLVCLAPGTFRGELRLT